MENGRLPRIVDNHLYSKLLGAPRTASTLGRLVQRDRHRLRLLYVALVQDRLGQLKECLLDVDVRL